MSIVKNLLDTESLFNVYTILIHEKARERNKNCIGTANVF